MYINNTTLEQKNWGDLKVLYPNSSLPKNGTEIILDLWYLIHNEAKPAIDPYTQKVVAGAVTKIADIYYQTWLVEPLSQQEIDDYIAKAQKAKAQECDNYGQTLIDEANTHPQESITTYSEANKRRTEARRRNKADKQAGNIALDELEKDQAKIDQKLSEYETKVWKDSDKAITNMMKLDTATEIYAFDVPAQNWTIWVSPV